MSDGAARLRDALRDPLAVCEALGLTGEGRGSRWFIDGPNRLRVRCPWHEEKTGSCSVTQGPDGTIRVRCFGCGTTGDVLSLVAVVNGLDVRRDFVRVLDVAAQIAGVAVPVATSSTPSPRRAPAPRVEHVDDVDDGVVDLVAAVLRERAPVAKSASAMEYLRARRIAHGAALGWFALPDEPHALDGLRRAIVEAVGHDAWMRCGLAWPSGDFDPRWRGRLVVPWDAPNGAVDYLVGRAIGEPRASEARYMGLARRRPHWPYGCADLHELAGPDTAVAFVEGSVDAVSFNALCRAHGVDCLAVGLPGADNWRDAWAAFARGRMAVVALDDDKAGVSHGPRIALALDGVALDVTVRLPARGKDWNDVLCTEAT